MDLSQQKELIKNAQKNPEEFGRIFEMYYKPIFGYIVRRVGNADLAHDITSETFFKALTKLWQFKWKNISISSWIYRIATNEIAQHYRSKESKHQSLEVMMEKYGLEPTHPDLLADELIAQEIELEKMQQWKKVSLCIKELPLDQQNAITLQYFEKKTIAEIAEILGKKEGTVKSLISRGKMKLREKCNFIPIDAL